MLADSLIDRRYVSRYAIEAFGFRLLRAGVPASADGDVAVLMEGITNPPGAVFNRLADETEPGVYEILLSSQDTSTPGIYRMEWTYTLDGAPQVFVGHLEVGESSQAYDRLTDGFKGVIESAYIRFADLFDSPNGGPHLQVYFQTNFGRGRMAQLLQVAVQRLNIAAQPHMTYSLDPQANPFPFAKWGGLLDQALYIECIKHLIRSYVEQPDAVGVAVARQDRRDYMSRWQSVLDAEQREFASAFEGFKIAHMGLGRPHVLVSGGVYGNYGPTRLPGTPAQPRYWSRVY